MADADVTIRIKTEAETQALKETEKALGGVSRAAHESESPLNRATGGLKDLAREAAPGIAALGTLAGVVELAREALKEYAETEREQRGLAEAVANQGKFTHQYAAELRELAERMQALTAIDSSKWLGVLKELTVHGANSGNIEQLTKAVGDLAGMLGTDVSTAAMVLGRAMEGNYEPLHRFGIQIKEGATQAETFQNVLKDIGERGGGILEGLAKTTGGQLDALNLAFKMFLNQAPSLS